MEQDLASGAYSALSSGALERGMTTREKTIAVKGLSEQEFWRRLGFTADS